MTHDSKAFPELLRKAERYGRVFKVYADRVYNNSKVYRLLEEKGWRELKVTGDGSSRQPTQRSRGIPGSSAR